MILQSRAESKTRLTYCPGCGDPERVKSPCGISTQDARSGVPGLASVKLQYSEEVFHVDMKLIDCVACKFPFRFWVKIHLSPFGQVAAAIGDRSCNERFFELRLEVRCQIFCLLMLWYREIYLELSARLPPNPPPKAAITTTSTTIIHDQ